ncbi:MAG: dihydroorotate dehydrogenase [bacterium]
MTDLTVRLGSTVIKTPIIGASGCSGWGKEISRYNNMGSVGGFITKSVTLKPKRGNDPPRLHETPAGLLNSIGLENEGLDYFIDNRIEELSQYETSVFVNLAPFEKYELTCMIEQLNAFDCIDGYEINISCPNVHKGGFNLNSSIEDSKELLSGIRCKTDKTLILKLSPAFSESFDIALFAEDEGIDSISFTNTYLGTAVDIDKRRFVFSNKVAGLSGPAVKPMSLWNVYRMTRTVDIPVIGIGGIMNTADIIEYIMAGAHAVQIGTGLLIEPDILERLPRELKAFMSKEGFENIEDMRGIIK